MVALLIVIRSTEASSRTNSCLLLRATPWETLYLGISDRTMAACSVVIPPWGQLFGAYSHWRGSESVDHFASTSPTKLVSAAWHYGLFAMDVVSRIRAGR
jgi:hypothetical protein